MKIVIFILSGFLFFACSKNETRNDSPVFSDESAFSTSKKREYILGVHPLHNPQRLQMVFGPLMDYLSKNIKNTKFTLEASKDYADYNEKLKAGHFDFALPNPYQTLLGMKSGYHVFAKMGDDQFFKGIVLVRKDGPYKKISDLKGKTISFPAPTALAGAMMPQMYMENHGLKLSKNEAKVKYVGSQESSMLAVLHGEVEADATWPPPYQALAQEKVEIKNDLRILFETESLINNSLMVKNTIDKNVEESVLKLLLEINKTSDGKRILEKINLSSFEKASDKDYRVVENFIQRYIKVFGEIKK